MKLSEIKTNNYYSYDKLQIYKNINGKVFLALRFSPVKMASKLPVDINITTSTKEAFIEELKLADISDSMSHLLQEALLRDKL